MNNLLRMIFLCCGIDVNLQKVLITDITCSVVVIQGVIKAPLPLLLIAVKQSAPVIKGAMAVY